MRNKIAFFLLFAIFGVFIVPLSSHAAVKKTAVSPGATRCLTANIKALNNQAVKQMEKDVSKAGKGYEAAEKTYRLKLATAWEAMKEPYCGYGSRGVTAVRSSFQKTINRARTEFLQAAKRPPVIVLVPQNIIPTSTQATTTPMSWSAFF